MELCVKAAVIAMLLANASLFAITKGRPDYWALLGANLCALSAAVVILGFVAVVF